MVKSNVLKNSTVLDKIENSDCDDRLKSMSIDEFLNTLYESSHDIDDMQVVLEQCRIKYLMICHLDSNECFFATAETGEYYSSPTISLYYADDPNEFEELKESIMKINKLLNDDYDIIIYINN